MMKSATTTTTYRVMGYFRNRPQDGEVIFAEGVATRQEANRIAREERRIHGGCAGLRVVVEAEGAA